MIFAIFGLGPLELIVIGLIGMAMIVVPAIIALTMIRHGNRNDRDSDLDDRS